MRDLETLRLVYADRVNERDRLRDARRDVTARLGPIPASAGVIIAPFAALGPDLERRWTALLFGLALVPFVLVMVISARALNEKSYRELFGEVEVPRAGSEHDVLAEEDWLRMMIAFEREMFPKLAEQVVLLVLLTVLESIVT
jgi:hypothetical protein